MTIVLHRRPVEVTDYGIEIGEGVYVNEAYYEDTGEPLSDDEIDSLVSLYHSELYQNAYEDAVCEACDYMEDR